VAGTITVRELLTVLGVDADTKVVKEFDQTLTKTANTMQESATLANRMAGAVKGAIIAYASLAAVNAAKSALDAYAASADNAAKSSAGLGLTAEEFQELNHAAELSGATMEQLTVGMSGLARQAGAANRGSKESTKLFRELGVSLKNNDGTMKSQSQLLGEVADSLSQLPNGTKKSSLAMQAFGKSANNLIPLLNTGSAGIESMRKEARDLGLVISNEAAASAEQYNDAMLRLNMVVTSFRNIIAGAVLPLVTKAVQGFVNWWINVKAASRVSDAFNKSIVKLNSVLVVLAENALEAKLAVIALVSAMAVTHVNQFATALIATAKAMLNLGRAATLPAIKIALIAAAILAVILLINDLMVFAKGGDSVIGRLFERFGIAPDIIDQLRGKIKDFFALAISFGKNVVGSFISAFQKILPQVISTLSSIGSVVLSTVAKITPVIQKLFAFMFSIQALLYSAQIEILGALIPAVLEIVTEIMAVVEDLLPVLMDIFATIISMVMDLIPIFKGFAFEISDLIVEAIKLIGPLIATLIRVIVPQIKLAMTIAIAAFKAVLAIAIPVMKFTIRAIGIAIKFVLQAIDFVLEIWDWFVGKFVAIWEGITSPIMAIWEGIKTAIVGILQFAVNIINSVVGGIEDAVNGLIRSVNDIAETVGLGTIDLLSFKSIELTLPEEPQPVLNSVGIDNVTVNVDGSTDMDQDQLARSAGNGLNDVLRQTQRAAG
jgi:hypothetical protein